MNITMGKTKVKSFYENDHLHYRKQIHFACSPNILFKSMHYFIKGQEKKKNPKFQIEVQDRDICYKMVETVMKRFQFNRANCWIW